jgi:hypothetical protein
MDSTKDDRIAQLWRFAVLRFRLPHAVLVVGLGLSACGWHPLYERPSPDPASGGVGATLARIAIDPVVSHTTTDPLTGDRKFAYDSRAAQMLQNHLRDALNPYGQPAPATYHLAIDLSQNTHGSVLLGNGESTREDLVMLARYKLKDETGVTLLKDYAQVVTSYDVIQEPFNDLSAQRDALERGAEELAAAIQTRLSVFLTK